MRYGLRVTTWFAFVEDNSPELAAYYPISAIRSAVCSKTSFTLFLDDGSITVECSVPIQTFDALVRGTLSEVLRKGAGNISSVSFTRDSGD